VVRRTAHERGYTARVLLDESGDVTGKAYGVFGPPTAYVIDRQGRLLSRMVGSRSWGTPEARKLLLVLLSQRTK